MDDLKINYTSGAKKELETLIDDIKKRIEDSCVKDKYVAGDSCVEITAFDIENKKKQIAFQSTKRHKDLFGAYMLIILSLALYDPICLYQLLGWSKRKERNSIDHFCYLLVLPSLGSVIISHTYKCMRYWFSEIYSVCFI